MRTGAKLARSTWAAKVLALRDRLGLNQQELAQKLRVSAMTISRWERDINEPPAEAYIQLGKLAGDEDCWWFWERVGISRSEMKRLLS
jgi:transcriptional regulator with XRE-family HTH domain